jgi:two-component system cell cycle response regulator
MTSRLSAPFELDEKARSRRLALLNLSARDQELAVRLQGEVIRPNIHALVEHFFAYLLGHQETAARLADAQLVERLRRSVADYLISLGVDFDSSRYTNDRIRVGHMHARIGVPLATYLCATRALQEILIDFFPPIFTTDLQFTRRMISFVLKIVTYDATLAMEAYAATEPRAAERSRDGRREPTAELGELSVTDSLTGIANRAHVVDVLESSLAAAQTRSPRTTVLMVDLDDFKRINETYGTGVGDKILVDVARRIHSAIRGFDIVGRYGGEEFLVVLSGTELAESRIIAERIRRKIADSPIHVEGRQVAITISIGLCELQLGDSIEALVGRAEGALYAAKAAGKNQTYVFGGDR